MAAKEAVIAQENYARQTQVELATEESERWGREFEAIKMSAPTAGRKRLTITAVSSIADIPFLDVRASAAINDFAENARDRNSGSFLMNGGGWSWELGEVAESKVCTGTEQVPSLDECNALLSNPDAREWARVYCALHGGDEGLMLAWFASSICCGEDAYARRQVSAREADAAEARGARRNTASELLEKYRMRVQDVHVLHLAYSSADSDSKRESKLSALLAKAERREQKARERLLALCCPSDGEAEGKDGEG